MTVRIVTDSSSDLPAEIVKEHGISVVPLWINIDGKGFLDQVELTREQFYRSLPGLRTPPTTSVPGPGIFRQVYERLADEGASEVLSVHISPSLSGVVNSAVLAGQETTTVPVTVLDARQLSLGTGYVAWQAAIEAAKGLTAAEIVAAMSELIPRIRVFAVLDSLEYLQRSGRMSGFQAGMGAILNIKPLLKMNDGEPTSEKIRGRRKAIARLSALVDELGPLESLDLLHTDAPSEIAALRAECAHLFPANVAPLIRDVTPVLGAHLGPGVVGFSAIQARQT